MYNTEVITKRYNRAKKATAAAATVLHLSYEQYTSVYACQNEPTNRLNLKNSQINEIIYISFYGTYVRTERREEIS